MLTVQQKVDKGEALLVENGHDLKNVPLSNFDMQACHLCVLGHLLGDYLDGRIDLGLSYEEAHEHGFVIQDENTDTPAMDYEALQDEWIIRIRKAQELIPA